MGKYLRRILAPLGVLIILVFVIGYRGGAFGVPEGRLEAFSRSNQPIPEDWICQKDITDGVAALLFYPEDKSNAIYSVYIKGNGLSFSFHSRSRGFMHSIQESICEFHHSESDTLIFLSLNKPRIEKIELAHNGSIEEILLDPDEPFALVLPLSATATLYDDTGQIRIDVRSVVTI